MLLDEEREILLVGFEDIWPEAVAIIFLIGSKMNQDTGINNLFSAYLIKSKVV